MSKLILNDMSLLERVQKQQNVPYLEHYLSLLEKKLLLVASFNYSRYSLLSFFEEHEIKDDYINGRLQNIKSLIFDYLLKQNFIIINSFSHTQCCIWYSDKIKDIIEREIQSYSHYDWRKVKKIFFQIEDRDIYVVLLREKDYDYYERSLTILKQNYTYHIKECSDLSRISIDKYMAVKSIDELEDKINKFQLLK